LILKHDNSDGLHDSDGDGEGEGEDGDNTTDNNRGLKT